MWLTKNEKKVLKLLIDNAKLSDTSIANQLKISSQAVGQIRRKLEEEIIEKYTVELDLKKLGLNLGVIGKLQINSKCERPKSEIEKCMIEEPHSFEISRSTEGESRYSFCSFFKNIHELEAIKIKQDLEKCKLCEGCVKIQEISHIPIENILKHGPSTIFKKCVEDIGLKDEKFNF